MQKLQSWELHRPSAPEALTGVKIPVVAVLDNIRSGLNVGSIFRSADAFALEKLVLCGITSQPPHREILKTALGSTESVVWEYNESIEEAIEALKAAGYYVYALEQVKGSVPLGQFFAQAPFPLALVLGNEVDGVSESALRLCGGAIEIPQYGSKHSLNVAVSAGIAFWESASRFFQK